MSVLNKPKAHQGFSLLEVLVAFVVMGLVVGTLLQLYGTSMRSVSLADEMSFALLAAESQLARVGRDIPVEHGAESGAVDGSDYRWRVEMEPVELMENQDTFSLSLEPFRVVVTIEWDSDHKQRSYTLTSIRFGERK
ncbi:MAG: prepilin-type N-terminal cleavage/methylation domain-containing protein [Thiofilum sp.]|uniref:type IV pilus modification PilV family protein n=1 Tax=Thiofilum sp. TaxID=2212733 RepID=UPI0025D3823C|nr:prepilin-type N-terminal cleavage/methylation domain-containing protein [Thiofilum sp.]